MQIAATRPAHANIDDACRLLREADRLIASALDVIGRCDVERTTGMTAEMLLSLDARRTHSEARMMVQAAAVLRAMPLTKAAFGRGVLSWGQVRAIVCAVRTVDAAGRDRIDRLVGSLASEGSLADPDELVARVDDEVARLRADLAQRREDRHIEAGFLAVQPRLDGGASIYGEADAQSTATLLQALDAEAESPVASHDEDAPTRARQRFDALISMCEASLAGGQDGTRPRPRLIATIDVAALAEAERSVSARLLWALAGRPARLTPLATEVMACDATVVPVVFDRARPVAVGDAATPVMSKLRTALVARDGGCRFPGCGAPVSWCDAHHIRSRIHDGPTVIDNLLLLCRRCHRRVHRYRWRIRLRDDGRIEFSCRGRSYTSEPRARRPRE